MYICRNEISNIIICIESPLRSTYTLIYATQLMLPSVIKKYIYISLIEDNANKVCFPTVTHPRVVHYIINRMNCKKNIYAYRYHTRSPEKPTWRREKRYIPICIGVGCIYISTRFPENRSRPRSLTTRYERALFVRSFSLSLSPHRNAIVVYAGGNTQHRNARLQRGNCNAPRLSVSKLLILKVIVPDVTLRFVRNIYIHSAIPRRLRVVLFAVVFLFFSYGNRGIVKLLMARKYSSSHREKFLYIRD